MTPLEAGFLVWYVGSRAGAILLAAFLRALWKVDFAKRAGPTVLSDDYQLRRLRADLHTVSLLLGVACLPGVLETVVIVAVTGFLMIQVESSLKELLKELKKPKKPKTILVEECLRLNWMERMAYRWWGAE